MPECHQHKEESDIVKALFLCQAETIGVVCVFNNSSCHIRRRLIHH